MKLARVQHAITALRLVILPVFIYSLTREIKTTSYPLFILVIFTDFLDGYLAKKLKIRSNFGSYFDAITDFIFIFGVFLFFILKRYYSEWVLFLMLIVFMQFILTSLRSKQVIYDPVGKYYGSFMYAGIGFTLFFHEQLVYRIVTVGIVVLTVATLSTRLAYLLFVWKRK